MSHSHTFQPWPSTIPPQPDTPEARRCIVCGRVEVREDEAEGDAWRVESAGVALLNSEAKSEEESE